MAKRKRKSLGGGTTKRGRPLPPRRKGSSLFKKAKK